MRAIYINFTLGKIYNAPVHLRFDDTNPLAESPKYIQAIKYDLKWLGYKWNHEFYASDYFDILYEWAKKLIISGNAYIDNQTQEIINLQRQTPNLPGINSPYRNRSIIENINLFEKMKNGYFDEGSCVLRAKIDMNSPNMNLRDPIMYRIIKQPHYRTKNQWCIYPTYDWTHGQSDYLEKISHSLCSIEFENHRPLYNWFLDKINYPTKNILPKQREFARLNISYSILSKRKLQFLLKKNIIKTWNDPVLPTISGLRRRGYTAKSLINFSEHIGISKRDTMIDIAVLENILRKELSQTADRIMAVLNPIKIIITNYPDTIEWLTVKNHPFYSKTQSRKIPFSKILYIEKTDFLEEASNNFFRLTLGQEVRLKHAYIIQANSILKDEYGNISEIYCSYDPKSLSGSDTISSNRKTKATLHWVSCQHALSIEIKIYDKLFNKYNIEKELNFFKYLNHNAKKTIKLCYAEPYLKNYKIGEQMQLQRLGYFSIDINSSKDNIILNRIISLKKQYKNNNI